jgi:hypothetical protein
MPAMTKPVLTDPRRSGTAGGLSFASSTGDGLEMPVLFQLADQSQSKVLTPPARPKPERKTAPQDVSPAPGESAPPHAAKSEPPARPAAEPIAAGAAAAAASVPAASSPLTAPAVPAAADQPLLARVVGAAEPAAAPLPDSPTIRERAQLRQRRQAAAKGDWFQTQGKYIVVVFLVALVGTIYAAHLHDDSPPPPAIEAHTRDLASDAAGPLSEPEPTAVAQSAQPQVTAETDANPQTGENPAEPAADAVAETNPAAGAEAPAGSADDSPGASSAAVESPQVNLQAPIASQEQSPVEPPPDESLFPWANRQEQRVASRPQPETAPSSVPMPRSNPHYQPRPPTAGAAAPIPQAQQSTTGAPAAEQPAAAVYPVTDPATYRSFQAEAPRWPAPSGAAPATYENRVPTVSRPSGPRYERTGSGLY